MMILFLKYIFWISLVGLVYSYCLYPLILLCVGNDGRRTRDEGRETMDGPPPLIPPHKGEGNLNVNSLPHRGEGDRGAIWEGGHQLPGVTVIISAYNEEKDIGRRIENLLELDYPQDKLEIIIASDGSDDRTSAIALNFAAGCVIVIDNKERRGKVNVLNETVPRAKHDIIVFSDANTFFEKDALRRLVSTFEDKRIGCAVGRLRFISAQGSTSGDLEGVYWRYETFLKTIEGKFGALLGANGAIYAVRKELFYRCPPDTIIEDFVIPMKILEAGYKVIYVPEAVAVEEAAKHIIQEKRRRIRIGAGDFQALLMLWHMLDPRKGFASLAFFSHKVLRWFAPFFMIFVYMLNPFFLDQALYRMIFTAQSFFYFGALLGQMLSWSNIHVKVLNLFYYFVSMNLALFLGFVSFAAGKHTVKWERTER